MESSSYPCSRKDGVHQENLGAEVVLYDNSNHRVHRLNQTMAMVWNSADGQKSIGQIARLVNERLHCACDNDMVVIALRQLEREGLLEAAVTTQTVLPSRREMGRKFAGAGISAAVLPLLASMMAPTPAMARSVDVSAASYKADLQTATADLSKDFKGYMASGTAQHDYANGLAQGLQGASNYAQGNMMAANQDFKNGASDFENMLNILGF